MLIKEAKISPVAICLRDTLNSPTAETYVNGLFAGDEYKPSLPVPADVPLNGYNVGWFRSTSGLDQATDVPKSDTMIVRRDDSTASYYRVRYTDIRFTLSAGGTDQTEDYTLIYGEGYYYLVNESSSIPLGTAGERVLGHKLSEWKFLLEGESDYIDYYELKDRLNGDSPGPVMILDARLEPTILSG